LRIAIHILNNAKGAIIKLFWKTIVCNQAKMLQRRSGIYLLQLTNGIANLQFFCPEAQLQGIGQQISQDTQLFMGSANILLLPRTQ